MRHRAQHHLAQGTSPGRSRLGRRGRRAVTHDFALMITVPFKLTRGIAQLECASSVGELKDGGNSHRDMTHIQSTN